MDSNFFIFSLKSINPYFRPLSWFESRAGQDHHVRIGFIDYYWEISYILDMKRLILIFAFFIIVGAQNVYADNQNFVTNLSLGSSGSEVIKLQDALINLGYDIPAIMNGFASRGYFGPQTVSAVKNFQKANNIITTGYFGPLSRAKLNSLIPEKKFITITSPSSGSSINEGVKYTVSWEDKTPIPPCAPMSQSDPCRLPVKYSIGLSDNIPCPSGMTCILGYSQYTVAENVVGTSFDWVPIRYKGARDGQYNLVVCRQGTQYCSNNVRIKMGFMVNDLP